MAQQDVLNYIRETPHNTNVNVVKTMLNADGGGGGGSSDFSTAEVTFINNTSGIEMYGAFIYEYEGETPTIICNVWTDDADTQRLVLYKGNSTIQLNVQSGEAITVSGDATEDGGYVYVTGDCTITITAVE